VEREKRACRTISPIILVGEGGRGRRRKEERGRQPKALLLPRRKKEKKRGGGKKRRIGISPLPPPFSLRTGKEGKRGGEGEIHTPIPASSGRKKRGSGGLPSTSLTNTKRKKSRKKRKRKEKKTPVSPFLPLEKKRSPRRGGSRIRRPLRIPANSEGGWKKKERKEGGRFKGRRGADTEGKKKGKRAPSLTSSQKGGSSEGDQGGKERKWEKNIPRLSPVKGKKGRKIGRNPPPSTKKGTVGGKSSLFFLPRNLKGRIGRRRRGQARGFSKPAKKQKEGIKGSRFRGEGKFGKKEKKEDENSGHHFLR